MEASSRPDSVNEAVDRIESSAHAAVKKAAEATVHAVDKLSEKQQQIKDVQDEWLEKTKDYIQANPIKSLAIAAVSGFVLSRLLSR